MRATIGARNPNLQVVITHASHVCSQHLFGLQLRMYGMHGTQFDHARWDLLSLVIWSRLFWPSVTWNLRKAQRWSLEQKCFEVRSLSPALRNLWLLIVLFIYLFIIIFKWNMLYISCTQYLRVEVTDLHCSRRFPGTFWHFRKTPLRMWCSQTFGLQEEIEEVVLSISGCKALLILYIDRSSDTRKNWKGPSVRAVTSVQAYSWRTSESLIK